MNFATGTTSLSSKRARLFPRAQALPGQQGDLVRQQDRLQPSDPGAQNALLQRGPPSRPDHQKQARQHDPHPHLGQPAGD